MPSPDHTPPRPRKDRGIAILITLSVIAVLMVVALELHRQVRVSLSATTLSRERDRLRDMASSGIHAAMALLIKDKLETEADHLGEEWADAETLAALAGELDFQDGKLEIQISDELARIQVNALLTAVGGTQFNESQKAMWDRFLRLVFQYLEIEEDDEDQNAVAIINSLKDWLDAGDDDAITGLNGAESDYYESLEAPYPCRNGPLPSLDELVLVKGISPQLYYGAGEEYGLSNYLSVHGLSTDDEQEAVYPGKININTADLPVLMGLVPSENEDLAQAIFDFRQTEEGEGTMPDFTNPLWYHEAPGCADLKIDAGLITTTSDIFRIRAAAALSEVSLTLNVVVQRTKTEDTGEVRCQILSWREE